MPMNFCPLYSGSSGNCAFVQYGRTRILIDAGKPGKTLEEALRDIGVAPDTLDALLITHEHSDHISGAGILCRRYHLPVYATADTWLAMDGKVGRIPPGLRVTFDKAQDFYIGDIGVVPFPIPHDAADPVGYHLYGGGVSLSIATDLGHMTKRVFEAIHDSNLILLESNHDPDMLMSNDHYSMALKRRILGNHGHLSNAAAAETVLQLVDAGVHDIVLGHLSGENNTPELALNTSVTRAELEGLRVGIHGDVNLDLAWRDRVGNLYTIGDVP